MKNEYNGGLTREQFLFYEIRIISSLYLQGYSKQDILEKIKAENLFQFPTERMTTSIARTCFRRIEALDSETLIYHLANAQVEVAKQIMLKFHRIWLISIYVNGVKNGSDLQNKPNQATKPIMAKMRFLHS